MSNTTFDRKAAFKKDSEGAHTIMVIAIDCEKLAKTVGDQMKKQEERFAAYDFQLPEKWALIPLNDGHYILTDTECCFISSADKDKNAPFSIAIKRAPTKETKEDGSEVTHHYMFALWEFEITPLELLKFAKTEGKEVVKIPLSEHMGDRFAYNERITGNTQYLISEIKKHG